MKNLHKLALISAISFGFFSQGNPVSAQQQRITCQSQNGRYRFCETNTRGGVTFIRQISNAECRQGSTWGYDRNGIWVDQGCSAEFSVRDRGGNNNNINNNSGGDNTAAIIGGVLAVGAIAAVLASGSNNKNNNSNNNNSFNDTITCGSDRGNFTRCNTNISRRDRVFLKRQLSNSGCWENDTWGYDSNGIWVDAGCRGLFEIQR
ncbi:hypothetical protein GM3708_862 [Geminocystis sp. NIES-3708]|uniref:DUF3011 domain-containing protein n=1 Tax=Geminocystis sp. NIES-3708 TaxID=1615909 RepID=UPI0005FC7763|nr:DUF3011 domain-containing protein [Geminocystis sp. NIES-3708]BAQ60456.1 hypothetical protein GM3708_862 [Geminocystis sp. NIES-3708]